MTSHALKKKYVGARGVLVYKWTCKSLPASTLFSSCSYTRNRICSMTMGRPAMTPNPDKVPLPSPVDDKYLAVGDNGADQPAGMLSGNQFLHENMKLIGILGKILLTVYHSSELGSDVDLPRTPEVDLGAVLEIDRNLEQFESNLPEALRWSGPYSQTGPSFSFRRHSNVLHARYVSTSL